MLERSARWRTCTTAVEGRGLSRASGLGAKLGPVLVQLPPTMPCDTSRLDDTLAAFPRSVRVAVELGHESWLNDAVAEVLRRHGAASCLADRHGALPPLWRTADWGYVRFHEGRARPAPRYGRAALQGWADRIAEIFGNGRTVYAYFNNDTDGSAPHDAVAFARACRRARLRAPLAAGRD